MMLLDALKFSADKHRDQVRRGTRLPYVVHPTSVAFLVAEFKTSKRLDELMVAALLHDTLEDTETTFEEIAARFGPLVASLVHELTSDGEEIARIGKTAYLSKKMVGMSKYALTLKLADRLSNVLDEPSDSYLESTVEILDHLEQNRILSSSQVRLVQAIRGVCDGDGAWGSQEPSEAVSA